MKKIAIVNSSSFGVHFFKHLHRLESIGEVKKYKVPADIDGKSLAEIVGDADYIIASVTPEYDQEFFENSPNLKLISRHGIGYNNVNINEADQHNVHVSIVDGIVEQDAVAENAVALLMAVSRRIAASSTAAKQGSWKTRSKFMGYQFRNKTTGIIGLGNIGSRVKDIMKYGFNNKILAYDPYQSAEALKEQGVHPVDLETLLKGSDFISLNAFVNNDSYHMIGKHEFSLMQNHVIITNSARGELIDLEALIDALENHKIAGYGADVAEGEPVDSDYPLFRYENVTISPHTSAYTWECLEGMGDKCVSDVERVDQGLAPLNTVNRKKIK